MKMWLLGGGKMQYRHRTPSVVTEIDTQLILRKIVWGH